MPTYKLTIEYDGANYIGWQKQDGLPSIQSAIEDALSPFDVRLNQFPVRPRDLFELLNAARTRDERAIDETEKA